MTVLRGKAGGNFVGDTYHTATMIRVGYGSLPVYRSKEEAIDLSFDLGGFSVHFHDNFVFCTIEATTPQEAFDKATREISKFLQNLSLCSGRLFTSRPLIIESEDGKVFPVPKYDLFGNVTIYNLEQLRKDIIDAQKYQVLSDQRLGRALGYLGHAWFLFEKRMQIADPLSEHFTMLIASIFLNLWKATSTVVGDPSKPEDSDYRKRYKKLGFDEDYDVAHYSLTDERIKDIEKNFSEAAGITNEILRRYREFLLNPTDNSSNQDGDSQSTVRG
jgi:hypothetical protein